MIKLIDKILATVLCTILIAMVLGCSWQIFTRFVLNDASKYTEEILRYMLIYLTMLGIPYTYGQGRHLAITLITKTFTQRSTYFCKLFVEGMVDLMCIFILIGGGTMVTLNSIGQTSPAMGVSVVFYYVSLPIAGVLTLLYSAVNIKRILAGEDTTPIGLIQGSDSKQAQDTISKAKQDAQAKSDEIDAAIAKVKSAGLGVSDDSKQEDKEK